VHQEIELKVFYPSLSAFELTLRNEQLAEKGLGERPNNYPIKKNAQNRCLSMAAEQQLEPICLTNGTGMTLHEHSKGAWHWWRTTLNSPRKVLAPMVEQSELPYRVLSREYGADVCYSPMIHSRLYSEVSCLWIES